MNSKKLTEKNKLEIAKKNILRASFKPKDFISIQGYDFNKSLDYNKLLDSFLTTGFQATNLAKAIEIIKKMREDKVTTFLGYTSNMVTSGLRDIFRYLAEHKLVDVIVTTGGGIEEDLIKCYNPFILGEFNADGKEEIKFTGLENIRSDWTELAKKFQYELLDKVFHNKEVAEYVKQFVKDLESGKYDDLLVYKKNIRKELIDYVKSTPPHVKAARQLQSLESSKIEYVITEEGPEPIQNIKHKIDYKHYIDKQIKPIADAILVFFNINFDDLVKGNKQVSLFDY